MGAQDKPFPSFLRGHPTGPDCDARAHLKGIFDHTIGSLRGDATDAARALQNVHKEIASWTSDLQAMTVCMQAV